MTENEQKDRFSFLWLALSIIILIFGSGRWVFPLAAWVGPVFLLRFVRSQKPLTGYMITVLVIMISSSVAWHGTVLLPLPMHIVLNLIVGLFMALPYLADRIAARRLQGFLSTLIFPAAVISLSYVLSFNPGSGTWRSPAYTQYGNLPLMQLASITGLWGIVFLISWFASAFNYYWENGFVFAKIKRVAGIYLCVLLAVFIYGGARLLITKPAETSVRVAAITTPSDIRERGLGWATTGKSPFNLQESMALLKSQTVKAAASGAKIIAWQEYSDWISNEDMDAFIKHGQKIASAKNIYLLLSVGILDIKKKEKGENVSILIDPMGDVKWKYLKSYVIPGAEEPYFKNGNKKIPIQDTPYGKIASVICFDFDFPVYIRSVGRGISLFLVPSFDWKEITPMHSQMAVFRAIENGFPIVRPAGEGLSIAVDYCGRVIAQQNYFTSKERIMLADVPLKSVSTIYSVIGDVFAWLCITGLIILIVVAVIRRRQINTTS